MKILVLNCGSSSIKYKLFEMTTKEILAQGGIEKIGLKGSFLKLTLPNGEKVILEKDIPEHTVGVEFIFQTLTSEQYGVLKSLEELDAVGHRMVHGGERFSQSVLLNKEALGSASQPGQPEGCSCRFSNSAQHTAGRSIRYRIPPDNARLRLHVCHSIRTV